MYLNENLFPRSCAIMHTCVSTLPRSCAIFLFELQTYLYKEGLSLQRICTLSFSSIDFLIFTFQKIMNLGLLLKTFF